MVLTAAEDTKKRLQKYTEELYEKDLNPDNHNGLITHLEPDILQYEVKWTLGSITTNKVSGGDGIPAELLKGYGCDPLTTPSFLASGGEDFDPGPEMRLDHLKLLCSKVLLTCKRDRESF